MTAAAYGPPKELVEWLLVAVDRSQIIKRYKNAQYRVLKYYVLKLNFLHMVLYDTFILFEQHYFSLLTLNSYPVKLPIFKYTIQWHLVVKMVYDYQA